MNKTAPTEVIGCILWAGDPPECISATAKCTATNAMNSRELDRSASFIPSYLISAFKQLHVPVSHFRWTMFPAGLFTAILFVYLFSFNGHFFYVTDGWVAYHEARMLVETGRLFTPWEIGEVLSVAEGGGIPYVKLGKDGRFHSKYGPGMSLVEAPILFVARPLFTVTGIKSIETRLLSLVNPVLTAGTAVLIWTAVTVLGFSRKRATFIGLSFAFSAFVWPYVSYDFSEPLQAFCIMASVALLFWWKATHKAWLLPVAGCTVGFAVVTKVTLLVAAPWLLYYTVVQSTRMSRLKSGISLSAPIVVTAAAWALYNHGRFGSPLDFGYDPKETFSTAFGIGFFGLTFSLNRGIFLFAPLLVLFPFGIARMWHDRREEAVLILGIFLTTLGVYCKWWGWHGGMCWGPRYLVPVAGLVMIPVVFALSTPFMKRAALVLSITGCFVNLGGVLVDGKAYRSIVDTALNAARERVHNALWEAPEFSQISGHMWLLAAVSYGQVTGTGLTGENILFRRPPWILSYPNVAPQPIQPQKVMSPWIMSPLVRKTIWVWLL